MKFVSTLDLDSGRASQKIRTRDALVAAARDVVAEGRPLTVEAVAERARISRTTAYRYFPNRRLLLAAAHPETTAESLLGSDPPADVAERLLVAVRAFTALIRQTEQQQRVTLRLSLEHPGEEEQLPLRQGRAIGWFREALTPLQGDLEDDEIERLAQAVRATTGIEALVWLTDVAGLAPGEAQDLMCWSALALLQAARTSPPPVSR